MLKAKQYDFKDSNVADIGSAMDRVLLYLELNYLNHFPLLSPWGPHASRMTLMGALLGMQKHLEARRVGHATQRGYFLLTSDVYFLCVVHYPVYDIIDINDSCVRFV